MVQRMRGLLQSLRYNGKAPRRTTHAPDTSTLHWLVFDLCHPLIIQQLIQDESQVEEEARSQTEEKAEKDSCPLVRSTHALVLQLPLLTTS